MIRSAILRAGFALAASTLVLNGCATTGTGPRTAQEKIARCLAVAGGSGLLGSIIGNNVGDGDARQGALIGAGIGGAACAAWTAFSGEDQRRLEDAQRRAAVEGRTVDESWTGTDGKPRRVVASPAGSVASNAPTAPSASATGAVCRQVNTTATANGASDEATTTYCRDANGNWNPATA